MKTITYDPENYTVKDTIEFDDTLFQKVQFPDGNYGIVYVIPDANAYDVILVGTDDDDTYCNVFLEFARSQTEVLNKIHENIDEVTLVVQLNDKQSEVFKEIVGKDEANDLIERLKIANEIMQLEEEAKWLVPNIAEKALTIVIILSVIYIIWSIIQCIHI